nr:hypothetical protein [uncultured Flavobacterium sp.]
MTGDCFKLLRKQFRLSGKTIVDHIKRNHFEPGNFAGEDDICSFCGRNDKLTKEHVLPKWSFQNDPIRHFETIINGTTQTFIKTVIPACQTCNNETLSKVEKYIFELFQNTDLNKDYFEYDQSLNIIRWLEIIDFKFHVLNFRRKYRKGKSDNFIPILKDIPMSVMRLSIELSPYKAISQLRKSQERIKRREKDLKYYSLVFWKSKNKQSLFFHTMDEYIFFEFPEFKMALFYFFNKEFGSNYEAEKEAKQIVSRQYGENP